MKATLLLLFFAATQAGAAPRKSTLEPATGLNMTGLGNSPTLAPQLTPEQARAAAVEAEHAKWKAHYEKLRAEQEAAAAERVRARAEAEEDRARVAELEKKRQEALRQEAEIARKVQELAGQRVSVPVKSAEKEAKERALADLIRRAVETGGDVIRDPVTGDYRIVY
ncbi:MAG: hypothetical protein K8R23_09315 [Chthoniobacter sp.]|nr:hypothetical protein [Chthoniobacter sp.]